MSKISFEPFLWRDKAPAEMPFGPSDVWQDLRFDGECQAFAVGDTWFPSWASDGHLYSPWTDGSLEWLTCCSDGLVAEDGAHTGHGVIYGESPENLSLKVIGKHRGDPFPYGGRYPSANLVHDGIWYIGTYCVGPAGRWWWNDLPYAWPIMGPMVGFRWSEDLGKTWNDTLHTPSKPLFQEPSWHNGPVKFGAAHFVDFGKNMCGSPDGFAYLIAQGSTRPFTADGVPYSHNGWCSADSIYLARVKPSPQTINDPREWEIFCGLTDEGSPTWATGASAAQPLLTWEGNMGCSSVTWSAVHQRFFLWVTDGFPTMGPFRSYLLESPSLFGPWKRVVYMKDFGEQAYFLNFPSKFIEPNGSALWLAYSANFHKEWKGRQMRLHPPGSCYGLTLQKVSLVPRESADRSTEQERP